MIPTACCLCCTTACGLCCHARPCLAAPDVRKMLTRNAEAGNAACFKCMLSVLVGCVLPPFAILPCFSVCHPGELRRKCLLLPSLIASAHCRATWAGLTELHSKAVDRT